MVTMTDAAQTAVRGFLKEDESLHGKVLRIFVQGGGCSGFQYGFTFSEKEQGDQTVPCNGFDVAIDATSLPYLEGSLIDFVSDGLSRTFRFDNPNATEECGCGESFTIQ